MDKTWKEIVQDLPKQNEEKKWLELEKKAYNWATDASSDFDVPKEKGSGMPIDHIFRDLCNKFYVKVLTHDTEDIKNMYLRIENRFAEMQIEPS